MPREGGVQGRKGGVAAPAHYWTASTRILFKDEVDCCANERLEIGGQIMLGGADHSPIRAIPTF